MTCFKKKKLCVNHSPVAVEVGEVLEVEFQRVLPASSRLRCRSMRVMVRLLPFLSMTSVVTRGSSLSSGDDRDDEPPP